jgi:formylglycine-generating enzyme required for sulfatase activity
LSYRYDSPRYWIADVLGPLQISTDEPPGPAPQSLVWNPGGTFWMGNEKFADANPVHRVYVDGRRMDKSEVTSLWYGHRP